MNKTKNSKAIDSKRNAKQCLKEGNELQKQGYFYDAIESYKKAIELSGDFLRAYTHLGTLLVNVGEEEEGISILQKAVEIFPKHSLGYISLSAALIKKGQKNDAVKLLRLAIENDSSQPLWVYYESGLQAFDIVAIEQFKIAYLPMPKCASSTLKSLIVKLEKGQEVVKPHQYYNNPSVRTNNQKIEDYKDYFKLVVIRDPIKRFLSYFYKNIKSSKSLLGRYGDKRYIFNLDCIPEINYFIEHLEDYIYTFIDVRHHTLCQSAYIGKSLDSYDLVCTIEELDKVQEKLQSFIGKDIQLPHLLRSQDKIESYFPEISICSLKKLIDYYANDYDLLKNHYSPDDILREYKDWILKVG